MGSGQECPLRVAENLLQEEEPKVEKEFQLSYSWFKLKVSKKTVISKKY